MPYMGEARNSMLEKLKELATFIALFTAGTAESGWASSSSSSLKKAGHGLNTGDLVLASALTGGANSNIVAGRFYWVKKVDSEHVELSQTNTFVQETWPEEITALTLTKHTEVSGTPYKRIATAFKTPAKGLMEDNTSHTVPCAEGTQVNAVAVMGAETGATTLYDIEKVAQETVLASKAYVVSNEQFDLLK